MNVQASGWPVSVPYNIGVLMQLHNDARAVPRNSE